MDRKEKADMSPMLACPKCFKVFDNIGECKKHIETCAGGEYVEVKLNIYLDEEDWKARAFVSKYWVYTGLDRKDEIIYLAPNEDCLMSFVTYVKENREINGALKRLKRRARWMLGDICRKVGKLKFSGIEDLRKE